MRVTLRPSIVLFALFLILPSLAFAQIDKATLEVVALDGAGAVIPGVTVTATNVASGFATVAVTGGNGMARVASLTPGTYRVALELSGFAPVVQEKVALLVGQTAKMNITMKPSTAETITVTAESPIVDVYKSDTSTNITPQQITELPVPDRDFQKLAFIAPGVQRERGGYRFITNSPVVGSGGNASQQTIMVDGVDFTDQALGLSRVRFSQDAIQEFRVVNNRFDSEIGNSQGGAMSIVTRTGSNDLHGSVFGFYRGDSLRTQGKLETGNQDFSRYQVGFTVGGPIQQDVNHYFGSFEYINEDNIVGFRPGGTFASQAKDISHPFNQTLGLLSYDQQLTPKQTLLVKGVLDKYREDNFRVGLVADESSGMQLNRDNWNLTAGHTWLVSNSSLNNLNVQYGQKKFAEPNNSNAMSEYFTFGTTLITGANIVGDQEMTGDYFEVRDTYHYFFGGEKSTHDMKVGLSAQNISESWYYPIFPTGLLFWAGDTRTIPYRYDYAVGDPNTDIGTNLYGAFVQDEWKIGRDVTVNLGLRYDYDTDGNNPDFTHPVEPQKRHVDNNNIQPRFSFVWDVNGSGSTVIRGGSGKFTGRYLLVPAFVERQQNGISGRTLYTRINGLFLNLPPAYWLNPADLEHTGVLLAPNIALLAPSLEAPEAVQSSLGITQRIADTGLFATLEGVYAKGTKEIINYDVNWTGSAAHRPNPAYTMINEYTNDGYSKYKALIATLNGTISGGHLLSASLTYQDRKNIADDFSPAATEYPSDPMNIKGEWGRARTDERLRAVISGVFRLPWSMSVAPIYEYGSGQPWTRRLGYDANGDLRLSDRDPGVKRNAEDGPEYNNLSLRITKRFNIAGQAPLEVIVEGFNILNNTNYDVNSVNSAEFLNAQRTPNPLFGTYSATLSPREIQLGLRWAF